MATVNLQTVQALIELAATARLSHAERLWLNQVAADVERARQEAMLAGLPGLQEGDDDAETVPAAHSDGTSIPTGGAEPSLRANGAGSGAVGGSPKPRTAAEV